MTIDESVPKTTETMINDRETIEQVWYGTEIGSLFAKFEYSSSRYWKAYDFPQSSDRKLRELHARKLQKFHDEYMKSRQELLMKIKGQ
jgi:frataxin-like iron-binding protein CyaY